MGTENKAREWAQRTLEENWHREQGKKIIIETTHCRKWSEKTLLQEIVMFLFLTISFTSSFLYKF